MTPPTLFASNYSEGASSALGSLEFLLRIAEAVPVGLLYLDEERRYRFVNRLYLDQLGLSPDEVLGRTLQEVLGAETYSRILPYLDRAYRGEEFSYEISLPRARGLERYFQISYTVDRADGNAIRGVVVSLLDVTDRVLRERYIQENEERYRILAEVSPLAFWTADSDGKLTYCNQWWHEYSGLSLEETLGDGWLAVVHPEYQNAGNRLWARAKNSRGDYEVELPLRRASDGSYRWHLIRGRPVLNSVGRVSQWNGVALDIHDRKRAAEASAKRERELQQLADSIPQLAWMAHPNGEIFWFNKRWYAYTGKTPAEAQKWGWSSALDAAMVSSVMNRWTNSVQTGTPFEMEYTIRGADGNLRWFLTRVEPIRDEGGNVERWFGTNTIIEEQRRLREEREQILASERAARMDAERLSSLKDDFLATLSHELRTPLNAITGWTYLLRKGTDDRAKVEQGIQIIDRSAKTLAQLVSDLLDMSRITSGKMKLEFADVSLGQVIDSVRDSIRPGAEAKGVRLTSETPSGLRSIRGDPTRLQQIVWNLVSNAVKFSERGGEVSVRTEDSSGRILISVRDTGRGIAPDFLPYLFDRFRQADASATRKFGGLGIGLALVKQLVELHGGRVWAESGGLERGAAFFVELPYAAPAPSGELPAEESRAEGSQFIAQEVEGIDLHGVRVLVVDDEPGSRDVARRILEECGAEVLSSDGADEALKCIHHERVDVLLSDISMPGKDGYELIRTVRSEGRAVPAAALTAFARTEDRSKALKAGYQAHVIKPINPAALLRTVHELSRIPT